MSESKRSWKEMFYVMLNFCSLGIWCYLCSFCGWSIEFWINAVFPNIFPILVLSFDWTESPSGFLWNPSTPEEELIEFALSKKSLKFKQKNPSKRFISELAAIIPTCCWQNFLSHKICQGVSSHSLLKCKNLECGLCKMSRGGHKTYYWNFYIKKNNCAIFKVFNCFDGIINNLLYCILKVLVETFQNYNRSTLFSGGISDF